MTADAAERARDLVVFGAVPTRNVFEETVERLTQSIKLGLVRYGEPLPAERELAPLLGVSRVTLREAIRALQQAGYVESRRGRTGGTFVIHRPKHTPSERRARRVVKAMGTDAVLDALRFRGVVEPGAAALAAEHRDPDRISLLWTLVEEADTAAPADYRAADSRLHVAIAEAAGSASVAAAVGAVRLRLTDLLAAIPRLEPAVRNANRQHHAIVAAIADGAAERARVAMAEHVGATATLIRGFLT